LADATGTLDAFDDSGSNGAGRRNRHPKLTRKKVRFASVLYTSAGLGATVSQPEPRRRYRPKTEPFAPATLFFARRLTKI
jgi:hypothetical protein